MWRSSVLYFFVVIILFSSCRVIKTADYGKVSNIPDVKLRKELKDNELYFEKLYLKKANFTFDNGIQSKSFKGSIVVLKDSMIILSIYALMGIELVRAKFTPSEVIILDKHNKKVFSTNYAYFSDKYGVDIDFRILQSILSNSLFLYPSETDYYDGLKKYKHDVNADSYIFKSFKDKRLNRINRRNSSDLVLHEFKIYPEIFRIFNIYVKDFGSDQTLEVDYKNFTKFDKILFPEYLEIKGRNAVNQLKISLKINYLELNDGGSLHFEIPSSYSISEI